MRKHLDLVALYNLSLKFKVKDGFKIAYIVTVVD